MPSATGSITAVGNNKFAAVFDIDGENHTFSGVANSSAPSFASSSATLTYDRADELTATRKYNAAIAGAIIIIKLSNGPSIEGTLDTPGAPGVTYNVSGTGIWGEN
ncbi:hypothetical protein AURDEDRAFT_169612 [Auricularia subglabra TFB-10046 SS5]|uniref:Uncharacterized protein n=1 Tax=Auricularia subglabra (strain TFB-10046 / SS5) TaxID=717982 RepID=J0WXH5_AURST|nr:hypothetical protein AURDEDRAFT_169612 [Auricularia subglabra TFB-10046 SS5]